MSIGLRVAGPGDLDAVMALETGAFGGGAPGQTWSAQSWGEEIAKGFVVVAVSGYGVGDAGLAVDGDVVGVCAMRALPDAAEVLRVIVGESVRCTGIGRRLLDYGLVWALGLRLGQVFLEVSAGNAAAIRLYESAGFVALDRRVGYYGPGDDAVIYRWTPALSPLPTSPMWPVPAGRGV